MNACLDTFNLKGIYVSIRKFEFETCVGCYMENNAYYSKDSFVSSY